MNEMHDLIVTRGVKFSGVERLENVLNTALKLADAQDALRANARNVAENVNLTADGKREEVRKHIGSVTVKHLSNATKLAAKFREDLATWEKRLIPPPAKPADAASAAVRSQIRDRVAAMSAPERMKFLSAPDLPREVFAALLEGPTFLTGVTSDQRAAVLQSYRATYHAEDIAQIAQAQGALERLDARAHDCRQ
jgi:hypothetical protein